MSAAIQFNNVSLSYGVKDDAVEVLKGIDFSVDSEEVISIVGAKRLWKDFNYYACLRPRDSLQGVN